MLILSPRLLKMFGFCTKTLYFFSLIPFTWNSETCELYNVEVSKWYPFHWNCLKYFITLFQSIQFFKFCLSVIDFKNCTYMCSAIFVSDGLFFLNVLVFSIIHVLLLTKVSSIFKFTNGYIKFYKQVQGKINYLYIFT